MSPSATPHQQGRADFHAGVDRFANRYPMASANFASWRNGWNAAQTEAVLERSRAGTRRNANNNMNYTGVAG